jgi:hypothetical protein
MAEAPGCVKPAGGRLRKPTREDCLRLHCSSAHRGHSSERSDEDRSRVERIVLKKSMVTGGIQSREGSGGCCREDVPNGDGQRIGPCPLAVARPTALDQRRAEGSVPACIVPPLTTPSDGAQGR